MSMGDRRARLRAVVRAAWVCLLLSMQTATAQAASPAGKILWLGESDRVLKVATGDATVSLELQSAGPVQALGVDATRRSVWVLTPGRLTAYDFEGTAGEAVAVPQAAGPDKGRAWARHTGAFNALGHSVLLNSIAVDQRTGEVWVAGGETLTRIAADGTVRRQTKLGGLARDIALDPERRVAWVVTWRGDVVSVTADGSSGVAVDTPWHDRVRAVAFDRESGAFWLARSRSVSRHAADGAEQMSVAVDFAHAIDSDGAGGAWVLGLHRASHIDGTGALVAEIWPGFASTLRGPLFHVAGDPSDGSAWISTRRAVAHFAADGSFMAESARHAFGRSDVIRAIALYADVVPPELTIERPDDGAYVDNNRPDIELGYSEDADPETLAVTGNGQELEMACDSGDTGAACRPASELAEGHTRLQARISDHAGNTSEPAAVSFTVDTLAPEITIDAPADGTVTNQPEIAVTGSVNEAAELSVNGDAVVPDNDGVFEYDWSLAEGLNQAGITATDLAGNTGRRTVDVTLDTEPPSAVVAGNIAISAFEDGEAELEAGPGSAEPGAYVRITTTGPANPWWCGWPGTAASRPPFPENRVTRSRW